MKKFAVLGLAVVLVIAFTVPATAFESVFGGYWRTRAYMQKNFSGNDYSNAEVDALVAEAVEEGLLDEDLAAEAAAKLKNKDRTLVDTRTRLYYTAIFNENLKFVNKFEFDAAWGGATAGYGDIGADGKDIEVKNSYVDFTIGAINSKIGVQSYKLGRGFLFNDDFAGAVITYKAEAFELPFFWVKAYEGSNGDNNGDVDYYGIAPKFSLGDMGAIQPFAVWVTSDDAEAYNATWPKADETLEDLDIFYLGFDADMNFDMVSVWLTAMYQFGEVDTPIGSADVKAWLAAIGAKVNFDTFDLHGQIFYASGDDDGDDDDIEGFVPLKGQDYHWAEIMGGGIFDNSGYSNDQSNFAPGWNNITNVLAYNIGANFKVMDDLSLRADLWYAERLEADGDFILDEPLGFEVDFGATYKIMDNLNLDVVAAYLFADDATTLGVDDDENPYEIGAQLSLSF